MILRGAWNVAAGSRLRMAMELTGGNLAAMSPAMERQPRRSLSIDRVPQVTARHRLCCSGRMDHEPNLCHFPLGKIRHALLIRHARSPFWSFTGALRSSRRPSEPWSKTRLQYFYSTPHDPRNPVSTLRLSAPALRSPCGLTPSSTSMWAPVISVDSYRPASVTWHE